MPSRRVLIILATLFLLTLLWRLPARWVSAALPGNVVCEQATGTVWNGSCATLHVAQLQIHALHWQWLPKQLLRGRLGATVQIDDPQAHGSFLVLAGLGGKLQFQDLVAELPIANSLLRGMPAGWSGQALVNLPLLQWQPGRVVALRGSLQVRELMQLQPPMEFGSYELLFGDDALANGGITGAVRDLDGPLRVTGQLQLTVRGAYEFNGSVAATARTGVELARQLELLGAPDAQGNRPFSVAGTL